MVAVQPQMVPARCLRVGDVHEVHGVVTEIRPNWPCVWIGWDGRFGWETFGAVFTIVERGPVTYPAWFEDAAGFFSRAHAGKAMEAWRDYLRAAADMDSLQYYSLFVRALEIQAERRAL